MNNASSISLSQKSEQGKVNNSSSLIPKNIDEHVVSDVNKLLFTQEHLLEKPIISEIKTKVNK
jgi:hypothetical protein